jgi:hypothetical protein
MRAMSAAASALRRGTGAALEAVLILAVIAALVLAVTVVTGRDPATPGALARGSSDIWIANSDAAAKAGLRFGDQVAFGYRSDTAQSIQLQCFKPGTSSLVYSTGQLVTGASGTSDPFRLGPSAAWPDGAADCKALLGHRARSGKYMVEARVAFDVAP